MQTLYPIETNTNPELWITAQAHQRSPQAKHQVDFNAFQPAQRSAARYPATAAAYKKAGDAGSGM